MTTFEALGIDARLIQATDELGYVNPTAIQEQAIPVLLSGTQDFIGLAQTGTGKTAAFGLPLLQRLLPLGREAAPPGVFLRARVLSLLRAGCLLAWLL